MNRLLSLKENSEKVYSSVNSYRDIDDDYYWCFFINESTILANMKNLFYILYQTSS